MTEPPAPSSPPAQSSTPVPSPPPAPVQPPVPPASATPTPAFIAFLAKVPFTTTVVVVTVVLGLAFGTFWSQAQHKSWYHHVAYGLPAFEDGRYWTLVFGPFFAVKPYYYIATIAIFGLLCGFAEYRLGTARTMVVAILGQIAAVLATALFLLIFRNIDWPWAVELARRVDLNFTSGAIAAACVASATVKPPWRLRMRLAIWATVLFTVMFVGSQANLEHFFAVLFTLPFSLRLAGPRGIKARALPTRRELRLLAAIGAVYIAAIQLLAWFLPDRLTPFGPSEDADQTWYFLVLSVVISLLIANGLRKGYRWAWWVAVILCLIPLVLGILVFTVVIVAQFAEEAEATLDGIPQFTASLIMYLLFLIVLFIGRDAFRVPRRSKRRLATSTSQPELAKELLRQWGGSTISWMTTWPENRHMVTADGQSYIAFRKHAGVAVALGDPVGPPGSAEATIKDFVALCDKTAVVPYLFSSTAPTVAVTDALGWQSAQVAEDNLIDLPGLEFKGKSWQDIRTALNRAKKESVRFELVELADQSWQLVQQVEHLSQDWLGDKELPEMGFTLGGVPEALDREVKVALAINAEGTVDGVLSWMPVYQGDGRVKGWTLDLMRRRDGGFRATIEFLIASSCLYFQEQGYDFLSLSGAPLARSAGSPPAETAIDKFLETLGATLEPVYGFRSLHAFKAKFKPRQDPMYMIYRDEADLPRIGIGITKAYLPDAGLGDLLSVVKK